MATVSFPVVPWRGHTAQERVGDRTLRQLDADEVVCRKTTGLREEVAAEDVQKEDIVCFGCLYRVVEEPKETDAAG